MAKIIYSLPQPNPSNTFNKEKEKEKPNIRRLTHQKKKKTSKTRGEERLPHTTLWLWSIDRTIGHRFRQLWSYHRFTQKLWSESGQKYKKPKA